MSSSAVFRSVVSTVALAVILAFAVGPLGATPPAAPALTTDTIYPNLFFGAIPNNGNNAPVLVFVHGLGGNFQDWIEQSNCPTSVVGCLGSKNDMYDYAFA